MNSGQTRGLALGSGLTSHHQPAYSPGPAALAEYPQACLLTWQVRDTVSQTLCLCSSAYNCGRLSVASPPVVAPRVTPPSTCRNVKACLWLCRVDNLAEPGALRHPYRTVSDVRTLLQKDEDTLDVYSCRVSEFS